MRNQLFIMMCVAALTCNAATPFVQSNGTGILPVHGSNPSSTGILPVSPQSNAIKAHLPLAQSRAEDEDMPTWNYGKPVYDLPEGGTRKLYSRSCDMFYYDLYNGLTLGADDCFAGEVVYYDNGDVYMRNMFASMISGSYLVGKLDGNKITLDFPQVLCYEDAYIGEDGQWVTDGFWPVFRADYDINMDKGEADVWIDEKTQQLTFTINEDGSISQEEGSMFGVFTQGGIWYGEAVWNMKYLPFDDEPMTMPAGLKPEKWALATDNDAYLTDIAFDGNTVYWAGVYPAFPNSVVKGEIQGNKVVFKSPVYLGVDEGSCHLAYFIGTKTQKNQLQMVNDPTLTYDAENGKMTYSRKYLVVNAGKEKFNLLYQLYSPTLYRQSENPVYGNPLNPEFAWVDAWQYDEWTSTYSWFTVIKIPNIDTKGNYLDTDRMWYNMYFDGEIFWFDEEDYKLVEASTDVPWSFDDADNFFVRSFEHYIYFYWTGWKWMAVQSIFEDPEGVLHKSDMVYFGDVDGIQSVESLNDIQSVEYYDLYGRRLNEPQGLCLRKAVYTDGTVKTSKIIRK